jgi:hypothetical protein
MIGAVIGRLLPLLVLLAYALAFAAAAIGTGPPAFDDHPGQLYRLVHAITTGPAPWAWNAGWWSGYPELQFYPPGFFHLGAVLHALAGGAVSPPAIYTALAWLAYAAPAVTVFLLLVRLLGSGWAALPGAFLALTLSAGLASGVEGAVHVGMLPARLAWALLPLVPLTLGRWLDGHGGPPWAAAPVIATIVLTHPAHAPAAAVLVVLGAWIGAGARWRRLAAATAVLAVSGLLTAFWTLPLLVRLEHARALAWGRLSMDVLTTHPLLVVLLGAALLALHPSPGARAAVVARFPWLMIAVVALDAVVLARLHIRWLPADRLADSAWLGVVLAAGLAIGGRLVHGNGPRVIGPPVRSVAAVTGLALLSLAGTTLTLWPGGSPWPSRDETVRGLRLADLWADLRRAPPGRVLFVRSSIPLVFGDGEWWRPHTHIAALTPLASGRAILNGTFTHPSPVAALLYRGSPAPGPITTLVEQLDGRTLFGLPLDALGDGSLDLLSRLAVSVIVGLDEDAPRLHGLETDPAFRRRPPLGPFLSWWRSSPTPAPPAPAGPGRWTVTLEGEPGAWVPARVTDYPLWQAWRGGERLATRRGPAWDLEVRLNDAHGPVELMYRAGWAERAGVTVSGLAAAGWLVAALGSRRRRP